jgi:FemAB-related protein (PEP-CTERM system-associated)
LADQPVTIVRAIDLADAAQVRAIDDYVARHPQGSAFHRPAWLIAVACGCGQVAHYLVAERDGAIVGLLPLTEVHSPLFGRALASSGFAVGGGPIADDQAIVDVLADAGWNLAVRLSCPSFELRGDSVPTVPGWHVEEGVYAGFSRPLAADDDAELLAIPRKQRAEVRKALGFALEVRTGAGERDRADHYAIYAESVRNLGTPVFPRTLFGAVLDAFGGDADILTVSHEGRPLASVLSLYHKGVVMPYWGGGTMDARSWRANDMMYYALMRHARERGATAFDFGRSKFGTGAFSFKKNWGFEPVPLAYAVRTADGQEPRQINPMSPRYRLQVSLWSKLPLGIANRIGPWIARGLG